MLPNELEILKSKSGECFFTNTFLSTTFYYNVALVFSGCDQKKSDRESVIFDFKLDTCQRSKPFADISQYSYLQDEREVLISMGTMFRLDSIEFNEILSVWIAELSLCEYDVTMNDYCLLFRRDPRMFFCYSVNILKIWKRSRTLNISIVFISNIKMLQ